MRASGGRSTLIVLTGPPCAGKTALAAALHRTVGGIRLDVDDIRLALLPTSNQREEDRNVAYSAMHLMVKHLIDGGVSTVVLAATYRRPGPRRQLADTVTGMAVDAFVVQCYVDGATAAERFTPAASRPCGRRSDAGIGPRGGDHVSRSPTALRSSTRGGHWTQ